uniref:SWIM-type domain-containing protein n=1 Tax=Magallana gigas TaxID=29159 RepID=A0A8W8IS37_MAGGI
MTADSNANVVQIEGNDSAWRRKQLSKLLRQRLSEEGPLVKNLEIHITLPDPGDHRNHLTGEISGLSQPLDEAVISKIHGLVHAGVRSIDEMKRHLRLFVQEHIQTEDTIISELNRRYYPTNKDIRNHMYRALRFCQFSTEDQENIQHMVKEWEAANPADHFYYRPQFAGEDKELNGVDSRSTATSKSLLFVHQSSWQQDLLMKYGDEICLLDATYNTSKYDIPLFFLCVNTNVGYSIVASFVVANENRENIKEGLQMVKEWNPEWNPKYFMTDFDEREIWAIENTFKDCESLLCDFHREQAWTRWMKDGKHGLTTVQMEVLELLRKIAHSATENEFHGHVQNLKFSTHWKESTLLQKWFEGKWLKNAKRWVWCFRSSRLNTRVTTTNGLERQHQEFKKTYLAKYRDGSLSSTLSVLISNYLPESHKRYIQYNIQSLGEYKKYSAHIPEFLHNRPKFFLEHCMKRIPPKCPYLPVTAITSLPSGEFRVPSSDGKNFYILDLERRMPSCSCPDWSKCHLPCKHMLSIFIHFPGHSWEFLHPDYTECPHFKVDRDILKQAIEVSPPRSSRPRTDEIDNTDFEADREAENDIPRAKSSTCTKSNLRLNCIQLLKNISSSIYLVPDQEQLVHVYKSLQDSWTSMQKLVPKHKGLPVRTTSLTVKRLQTKKYRSLPSRRKRRKKHKPQGTKSRRVQEEILIGTESAEDPELYGQSVTDGGTENPHCSFDSSVPAENAAVDNSLVEDIWAQKPVGHLCSKIGPYKLSDRSFYCLKTMLPDEVPKLDDFDVLCGAVNEGSCHWCLVTEQCKRLVNALCRLSPGRDLMKGASTVSGHKISVLFENHIKAKLTEVTRLKDGRSSCYEPHWRHVRWIKRQPLNEHLEMRNSEKGIEERSKLFGKGWKELYALVLEEFGVFKPKTIIRIGYCHGHYLSMKEDKNEPLMATLEDEMGQNMNEGVRYFKDVLFVESEIFVASLVWNLTLLEAERRLYPIN